jgi:hypothetical protein
MAQYTLISGTAPVSVNLGDAGGVIVNDGPGTVYYRDELPVSSATNDGSLASTAQATFTGTVNLTSDTRASVHTVPYSTLPSLPAVSTSGFPNLLAPYDPRLMSAAALVVGSGVIFGSRVVAGQSGTLRDLTVYSGVTSGNLRVGVYDTNDAVAASRSLLYGSGSIASAGTGAYQVVADPQIVVTAGKSYDLVVLVDNGTIALGRIAQVAAGVNVLPTGFLAVPGGALAKPAWSFTFAYAALPATITEAQATTSTAAFWIGGRIV